MQEERCATCFKTPEHCECIWDCPVCGDEISPESHSQHYVRHPDVTRAGWHFPGEDHVVFEA